MEKLNIYQKMLAITEEITAVAKNLSVSYGQSSYKAVGEADVLAAVKPIEIKHGVYSYPHHRKLTKEDELVKSDGKLTIFMRLETTYRFVNVDKPEEYIDIVTYGDGTDSQDKAPGKAMTYSDKYALLKAYKIITGDDPDQKASESMTKPKKPAETPKQGFATLPNDDDLPDFLKDDEVDKLAQEPMTETQRTAILDMAKRKGITNDEILEFNGLKKGTKLNKGQFVATSEWLNKMPDKAS